MPTMNKTFIKIKPQNLTEDLQKLIQAIDSHVQNNTAAHYVEKDIFQHLLRLGLSLLH